MGSLPEAFLANDSCPMKNGNPSSHYLVGYYTTHQPDGVYMEAHCTRGMKLEGVGQNDSATMSALWTVFREYTKGTNANRAS
jgi:hypothetical protein